MFKRVSSTRLGQRPYDQNLYAARNKIEQFFGHLKEASYFAIRYEKTAVSLLTVAHLLSAFDWMC